MRISQKRSCATCTMLTGDCTCILDYPINKVVDSNMGSLQIVRCKPTIPCPKPKNSKEYFSALMALRRKDVESAIKNREAYITTLEGEVPIMSIVSKRKRIMANKK